MALEHPFPRYPNYSFLQLEEINSMISLFTNGGFEDISCISTDVIVSKYSEFSNENKEIVKKFDNFRYNFSILSVKIDANMNYTWTISVYNTLWTGKWYLYDINGVPYNPDKYEVDTVDKKGNTFTISGKNLNRFILCLELSTDSKPRDIPVSKVKWKFKGNYNYTHQYDIDKTENCTVVSETSGKYINNATIKLVPLTSNQSEVNIAESSSAYTYMKSYTTNVCKGNGQYTIKYSKVPAPDTYYARLEAYDGEELKCTKIVTVKKINTYKRVITTDTSNLKMYRGEIRTFKFKITSEHKTTGFKNNTISHKGEIVNIYHKFNSEYTDPLKKPTITKYKTVVYSAIINENNEFSIDISLRGVYCPNSTLTIVLAKTDTYPAYTSNPINITHDWKVATDWKDLKTTCENDKGADCILLDNKVYTMSDNKSITINRSNHDTQYILGKKGKRWSTLDGMYKGTCFKLKQHINSSQGVKNNLILKGIRAINFEGVIYQEKNTFLNIFACCFQYNRNIPFGYQGAVVYQSKTNCGASIRASYFENNYANCITGRGNVHIQGNLFKITHVKYTYQPEPFVLEQMEGVGILKRNQFYINTSLTWDSRGNKKLAIYGKNRSYAKISVYVGKNATVNGKTRYQLLGDNTFNFFKEPYENKAYIFSAYWYPYSNVRAYIIASSTNSNINKATGHAVYGRNWAWKDGYYLGRVAWKRYNTYNPFVKFIKGKKIVDTAILVPESGGVI